MRLNNKNIYIYKKNIMKLFKFCLEGKKGSRDRKVVRKLEIILK